MMIYRPPLAALDVGRARRALQLVALCYEDDRAALDKSLAAVGAALLAAYNVDNSEAFLIFADGAVWIIYQGSDDLDDWKRNFNYVKADFPGGGRVHAGFFEAFRKIDAAVRDDLRAFPKREKIGVGHSLGAAVMQQSIVAYGLNEGFAFGSPRVGNAEFCARLLAPLWRFEHWTDPVCYLPPRTSPVQFAAALLHFRKPTLYDRAGAAILVGGKLHRMGHYVESVGPWLDALEINRATATARRVN